MKLETLIKFLNEHLPENMAEISYSFELLREVIDDTENEINELMNKFTVNKEYDKVRDLIDKLEQIGEYKVKIDRLLNEINNSKSNSEVYKEAPDYEEYRVNNKEIHTLNEDFVHKRPFAFALKGKGKKVTTWKEMLKETCQLLVDINEKIFVNFVSDVEMQGKKRQYFAYNDHNMNSPLEIKTKKKNIYVESHLNANGIRDLIKKILNKYKIEVESYIVYFRADYFELHKE